MTSIKKIFCIAAFLFLLPASLLAAGTGDIESVAVSPSVVLAGDDQNLEVVLVVGAEGYDELSLTFYQVLDKIASGGSASFINLEDAEITIPAELSGIASVLTTTTERVVLSLNADIPAGEYTFTFANTSPNSSAGGYAGYVFLTGFDPQEEDSTSYIQSNVYYSINADFGEGNLFDTPEVQKANKRRAVLVSWGEASYANSATSFDLEVSRSQGKVIKTLTEITSENFQRKINKKTFKRAKGKRFRVRMRAYYEDLDMYTEWSDYVTFKVKKK